MKLNILKIFNAKISSSIAHIGTKSFIIDVFESLTGIQVKGKWVDIFESIQGYFAIFLIIAFIFFMASNPKIISKALGWLLIGIIIIFFLNFFGWMFH